MKIILRILLGAFMLYAGIGHLSFLRAEFQSQVPTWLTNNETAMDFIVLASGVLEIAFGVLMVLGGRLKVKTGLALALFFVLIFPGNINQYVNEIDAFGLNSNTERLVRLFFQPVLIIWALWSTGALEFLRKKRTANMDSKSFFDFEINKLNGQKADLNEYKGKTIIVVNTASKCGLTPQYEGLEELYNTYKDKGLVVLGFPCNQFGKQEQGSADEIQEFCQINYGVSFPIFEKIEVNGDNAHPIFKYLKSELSGGIWGSRIKWNFTKFVIGKNGKPVKRFAPITKPKAIEKYITSIL